MPIKDCLSFEEATDLCQSEFNKLTELDQEKHSKSLLKLYHLIRDKNPKLPYNPDTYYRDRFESYNTLFGLQDAFELDETIKYCTSQLKNLPPSKYEIEIQRLSRFYDKLKQTETRLKSRPDALYQVSFNQLFGIEGAHYFTYIEAQKYCTEELNKLSTEKYSIHSKSLEKFYKKLIENNKYLPPYPQNTYKNQYIDLKTLFGLEKTQFFNFEQARTFCKNELLSLNNDDYKIESKFPRRFYNSLREKESRLPSNPSKTYKDKFTTFKSFFGLHEYFTYEEAQKYCIKQLSKLSGKDFDTYSPRPSFFYEKLRAKQPRLPSNPKEKYKNDFSSYSEMFGLEVFCHFNYEEAQNYLSSTLDTLPQKKRLSALNAPRRFYDSLRKKESRLPSVPSVTYKEEFTTYHELIGLKPDSRFTFEETREYCIEAISHEDSHGSLLEFYHQLRVEREPKLSAQISSHEKFQSIAHLFGKQSYYQTIEETRNAFKKLVANEKYLSKEAYLSASQIDTKIPPNPKGYFNDWISWNNFFYDVNNDYYSFEECKSRANKFAREHGISITSLSYIAIQKHDPKLPENPNEFYSEWDDWENFNTGSKLFITKCSPALTRAKSAGINEYSSFADYLKLANGHKSRYTHGRYLLPLYPHLQYNLNNFEDFLTFKTWDKDELNEFILQNKITTTQYLKEISLKNPYIPLLKSSSGLKFYQRSNFEIYDDLGYENWSVLASDYLKLIDKNLPKTRSVINKFLNLNILRKSLTTNPSSYFIHKHQKPNINDLKKYFGSSQKDISILIKFLEFVMDECCYDIDEETGDKTLLSPNLKHPYAHELFSYTDQKSIPSESVKPVLPMIYINKVRDFLVPNTALHFSDLKSGIDIFNEWFEVNEKLIDQSDPDCVWRKVTKDFKGDVCEIWCPVRLIAMYALFSTPLRGQQIFWLDSGEADEYKLTFKNKTEFYWENNDHPLAGQLENQGVLLKTSDSSNLSMHITTNKTSNIEGGYDIPYCPIELAYWLAKLRDWQSKFNPIKKPSNWLNVPLKHAVSERILRQRGRQCFLFREPINSNMKRDKNSHQYPVKNPMNGFNRLEEVLFKIQDNPEFPLATKVGNKYKSPYTPHSLRVSQITYLIFEAKVNPAVVAKLVGHANIVMTIYYAKASATHIREELELSSLQIKESQQLKQLENLLNDAKIKNARPFLITNSEANPLFNDNWPRASVRFMDFGICPMAQAQCNIGGEIEYRTDGGVKLAHPVTQGFLGSSNCPQCRFFITAPAFIGGLQNLHNEISLAASESKNQLKRLNCQIDELDSEIYELSKQGVSFDEQQRRLFKIKTAYEAEDTRLVSFVSDQVSVIRLIKDCITVIEQPSKEDSQNSTDLIINNTQGKLGFEIEEVSELRHLSEVCQGSEFYLSTKSHNATIKRSQILDRMMKNQGLKPFLFELNEEQQLTIGNQMINLMKLRLKGYGFERSISQTWQLIDAMSEQESFLNFININEHEPSLQNLKQDLQYLSQNKQAADSSIKELEKQEHKNE
jgi:hypothetical protein